MFVLPGHKYIGPGNSLFLGEPVDEDDRIAYKHDLAYNKSTTTAEILQADREAISEFWGDATTNYNYHSLLGAAGLGIKHLYEKNFGVIYPSITGNGTN